MAKVLVIEDESKVAGLLRAYLEKAGYEVIVSGDGRQGLALARSERPHVIILDLMLPGLPGEEVCRRLRREDEEGLRRVGIIMLTAKVMTEDVVTGLDLGADDYVTKPFSPREVVARVKALLRRASQTRETDVAADTDERLVFDGGDLEVDLAAHQVRRKGRRVDLTPTEFKLLSLLAQNPGRVFSRDQLSDAVLGYDYQGFSDTMYVHIKNLRSKIEPDPRSPRYIHTVRGVGYRFLDRGDAAEGKRTKARYRMSDL